MERRRVKQRGWKKALGVLKTDCFYCLLVFCFSEKKKVHDCFCDSGFSIFLLTSIRIESVGGIKGWKLRLRLPSLTAADFTSWEGNLKKGGQCNLGCRRAWVRFCSQEWGRGGVQGKWVACLGKIFFLKWWGVGVGTSCFYFCNLGEFREPHTFWNLSLF